MMIYLRAWGRWRQSLRNGGGLWNYAKYLCHITAMYIVSNAIAVSIPQDIHVIRLKTPSYLNVCGMKIENKMHSI